MKKTLISSVLAFSLAAASVSTVFADTEKSEGIIVIADPPGVTDHINATLEEVLSSFSDEACIFPAAGNITGVISGEGKLSMFEENAPYTLVTMKKGEKPPVEEINRKIGEENNDKVVFYNYLFTDKYKCYISGKDYQDTVYSILKDDKNVMSVEECLDVTKVSGYLRFILIDTEENADKIISEFPKPGFEKLAEYPENMKEVYLGYDCIIGARNTENPDYYKELNKIFTILRDKGVSFYPMPEIFASDDNSIYASSKKMIYQAEKSVSDALYGDLNADGKTDLTDLSELSLALVGDKELTESQQKAADVDGDGAVKLADLAKFRQYLSKVISSLG